MVKAMMFRLIIDLFDRVRREKLRRRFIINGAGMLAYYDADVMMGDCSGFYKLQMTDKNWQSLFKLMADFCHKCKKILDVGCGPYELITVQNDENAIGIDVCKVALKKLKSFGFRGQVVQAEGSCMPFRDLSFDCILSNQVIEHMLTKETVQNLIREMQRLSNHIMIITPNAAYGRKIYDPTHFFFFTTRNLRQLIPNFKIYCANPPYTRTLAYYLLYDSPRLRRIPIIGKVIFSICSKIDSSKLFEWLNKKLWPGSALVAIKTSYSIGLISGHHN
jgi:SAM-dependent methyltransferase